jgi:Tannase and feruloyl esterase
MLRTVLLIVSAAILLALDAPAAFAASDCTSIKSMTFPDATLTAAEAVTAGSLELQGLEPLTNLPSFCRVRVTLHPTTDSTIRFEAWLPQESWNGRLLDIGNGGFAGLNQLRADGKQSAARLRNMGRARQSSRTGLGGQSNRHARGAGAHRASGMPIPPGDLV